MGGEQGREAAAPPRARPLSLTALVPSLVRHTITQVAHLRVGVEQVAHELLVGPRADAKLALLPHLRRLAAFVGRRDTADVLLPPLLTFFNSQSWQVRPIGMAEPAAAGRRPCVSSRSPRARPSPCPPPHTHHHRQVRAVFYASLAGICPSLGPEGVAAVVLPFLDRMLGDPEPAGERGGARRQSHHHPRTSRPACPAP